MRWLLGFLGLLALAMIVAATISCGESDAPAELSLEDAIGQMLLVGFRGLEVDDELAEFLDEVRPGGVILYEHDAPSNGAIARNVESPEQLRRLIEELQDAAHLPYFVAIDAEGGAVDELPVAKGFSTAVPSHQSLGSGDESATSSVAEELAEELRGLGINWNFAPVVDVNVFRDSPTIGGLGRSFSADPAVVATHANAFIESMQSQEIIPILKHFPGHGSDVGSTTDGIRDLSQTYQREVELSPFRTLIEGDYAGPILVSHVIVRELDPSGRPASLSEVVVTELMRNDLGFDGVVVSDRVMDPAVVARYGLGGTAVAAIQAGVDVLLVVNQSDAYDLGQVAKIKQAILDAVNAGEITEQRIYESVERILTLKRAHGIVEQ